MTLSDLSNALAAVCPETYHLAAPEEAARYVVWTEYGMTTVFGDDAGVIRVPRVQIDAVCQEDNASEGFFESILDTLDALGVPYRVEDISYDESLQAMRCIIQCDVA